MSNPPQGLRKEFKATPVLKTVMADYFYELDRASQNGSHKIAWCSSVGPAELLRALGFRVYFPENHGAMLGANRMAADLIPYANAIGYSPDICSYLTSDIGSYLQKKTPLTRAYGIETIPRPDVLVYNTNQCRDIQEWFSWYAQQFNAPILGIHTHRGLQTVQGAQVRDISGQIRDLVPMLEKICGQKLDPDRLRDTVHLSYQTSELWRSCLETAAETPAPWTFFDAVIHMGPAVVARGTTAAVEYYQLLLKELKDRIQNKTAAVEGERHRLYWEGMPIWGKLRSLSEQFAAQRTAIAASTYCNSWILDRLDPDKPFESMAAAYTELFIVRDETYKETYIRNCFERYGLDGIIFHDAKTCPNNSNNRYGMPERLGRALNVPILTINGDLNDLRCYSEEQTRTNIEAFIEQLEERMDG